MSSKRLYKGIFARKSFYVLRGRAGLAPKDIVTRKIKDLGGYTYDHISDWDGTDEIIIVVMHGQFESETVKKQIVPTEADPSPEPLPPIHTFRVPRLSEPGNVSNIIARHARFWTGMGGEDDDRDKSGWPSDIEEQSPARVVNEEYIHQCITNGAAGDDTTYYLGKEIIISRSYEAALIAREQEEGRLRETPANANDRQASAASQQAVMRVESETARGIVTLPDGATFSMPGGPLRVSYKGLVIESLDQAPSV